MAHETVTTTPDETRALGAEFGASLKAGDVVLLEGELGAGKTTFVKGIADACGVRTMVRSPTFAIMHRYRGDPDIVHIDLYREDEPASLEDLDVESYQQEVVTVVEWPKGLTGHVWRNAPRVSFEHVDETTRKITLP